MIENELKMMLSQEQFKNANNVLANKYGMASPKIQINYYFDSEDFMIANNGDCLRVRQKNDKLTIEYKFQKSILNDIRKCNELNANINGLPNVIILSKIFPIDDDHEYKFIGNLVTERSDYIIRNAIVSLDKNYYIGKRDYELEIESENLDEIKNIQTELELNISANKIGKYERYYHSLIEWGNK